MLQIPPSPLSINKILISSRALNLLPTILLSSRINHKKKRIIQVYFTIDISDYNARSEEPIASSSHSRDIASRFLHALRLRRTGFTFRTKLAFIGPRIGRAVSIPVEPIFNGFITPAPSIEFLTPLRSSFRGRASARACLERVRSIADFFKNSKSRFDEWGKKL